MASMSATGRGPWVEDDMRRVLDRMRHWGQAGEITRASGGYKQEKWSQSSAGGGSDGDRWQDARCSMRAGKGTILVVDDSWSAVSLMGQMLAGAGYRVITASDGKEAIEKVRAERPDCAIVDIVLPGQSGFQLCRYLKQSTEGRDVPVILVSVKKTPLDVQWGLLQGADAYLIKPFSPQELLSTVERVLTGHR